MLTFLFGIRTRWVCMNMLLRLSLMVFCFLFCSCTTVVFVKVLEPQNKDITENVTQKKVFKRIGLVSQVLSFP